MKKKCLWLLVADHTHPENHLIMPTLAWMAKVAGAAFECYLEAERNGKLFASTGSTVVGGHHFQQFNYLHLVFDLKVIILGDSTVFQSTLDLTQAEIVVKSSSSAAIYAAVIQRFALALPSTLIVAAALSIIQYAPTHGTRVELSSIEIGPYLYPEIYFRQALALSPASLIELSQALPHYQPEQVGCLFLTNEALTQCAERYPECIILDEKLATDHWASMTLRLARRWIKQAQGVAFGDPACILSMLPALCREERVAVYAPLINKPLREIKVSWYTEDASEISFETGQLAIETGNRVLVGRQTGDGDLFEWSKVGVCLQISDPNRPAFPIVNTITHNWRVDASLYDQEPDDADLLKYARQGKVLATILWHSGEIAHNEAMVNLIDLVCCTGLKMGMGVHAERYRTCPQFWELIGIPRSKGGTQGLIEPLLHAGGMGVLAEVNCPPYQLNTFCHRALEQIREIAGAANLPKGYLAFLDTDLEQLAVIKPEVYQAIAETGLQYIISSAKPGRNRIIHEDSACITLNQSCRTIMSSSPFIRISTVEDLPHNDNQMKPAWVIATLDAPVVAFNPYIWRKGSAFMDIVNWLQNGKDIVNVTPHVISRYARILRTYGYLPEQQR